MKKTRLLIVLFFAFISAVSAGCSDKNNDYDDDIRDLNGKTDAYTQKDLDLVSDEVAAIEAYYDFLSGLSGEMEGHDVFMSALNLKLGGNIANRISSYKSEIARYSGNLSGSTAAITTLRKKTSQDLATVFCALAGISSSIDDYQTKAASLHAVLESKGLGYISELQLSMNGFFAQLNSIEKQLEDFAADDLDLYTSSDIDDLLGTAGDLEADPPVEATGLRKEIENARQEAINQFETYVKSDEYLSGEEFQKAVGNALEEFISSTIDPISQDIATLKEDIAKINRRVQSIIYVPDYVGKLQLTGQTTYGGVSVLSLDPLEPLTFRVLPRKAVPYIIEAFADKELKDNFRIVVNALKRTRAITTSLVEFPITAITVDSEDASLITVITGTPLFPVENEQEARTALAEGPDQPVSGEPYRELQIALQFQTANDDVRMSEFIDIEKNYTHADLPVTESLSATTASVYARSMGIPGAYTVPLVSQAPTEQSMESIGDAAYRNEANS